MRSVGFGIMQFSCDCFITAGGQAVAKAAETPRVPSWTDTFPRDWKHFIPRVGAARLYEEAK